MPNFCNYPTLEAYRIYLYILGLSMNPTRPDPKQTQWMVLITHSGRIRVDFVGFCKLLVWCRMHQIIFQVIRPDRRNRYKSGKKTLIQSPTSSLLLLLTSILLHSSTPPPLLFSLSLMESPLPEDEDQTPPTTPSASFPATPPSATAAAPPRPQRRVAIVPSR